MQSASGPDHDAHLLPPLRAIQILCIQDATDKLDVDRITKCKQVARLLSWAALIVP